MRRFDTPPTLTLTLTPSYPHTPTLPARKHPACRGFYGWASDSIGRAQKKLLFTGSIAMVYCWCTYVALLVQLYCTFGARMFYSSGTAWTVGIPKLDCWYSYAGPLVYLCWTFGIPMLNLWYQNALLFWYRFFNLFTDNIKANQNEEWRMKNCRLRRTLFLNRSEARTILNTTLAFPSAAELRFLILHS